MMKRPSSSRVTVRGALLAYTLNSATNTTTRWGHCFLRFRGETFGQVERDEARRVNLEVWGVSRRAPGTGGCRLSPPRPRLDIGRILLRALTVLIPSPILGRISRRAGRRPKP